MFNATEKPQIDDMLTIDTVLNTIAPNLPPSPPPWTLLNGGKLALKK